MQITKQISIKWQGWAFCFSSGWRHVFGICTVYMFGWKTFFIWAGPIQITYDQE